MAKKPKITFPDTSKKPDAGLVATNKGHYAAYTEDGKRRRFKLVVANPTKTALRKKRDQFYASLVEEGATVTDRKARTTIDNNVRRARVAADPMKYIRHEPAVANAPYSIRIGTEVIGRFTTRLQAQKARDKHLRKP